MARRGLFGSKSETPSATFHHSAAARFYQTYTVYLQFVAFSPKLTWYQTEIDPLPHLSSCPFPLQYLRRHYTIMLAGSNFQANLYNPWTAAMHTWPIHGGDTPSILGPRPVFPRPQAHTYMAMPQSPTYQPAFYPDMAHGYDAPPPSPLSAPSWDSLALLNHFNTMNLQPPSTYWYMDTGAMAHTSANAGILNSLSPHPKFRHVIVGDGSSLPVTTTGHTSLPSHFSNRPLHLNNVLVAPRIVKNLVSARQFTTNNNVSVKFNPPSFSVKDLLTKRDNIRCNSTGDLYLTPSLMPPMTPPCGTVVSAILVMMHFGV